MVGCVSGSIILLLPFWDRHLRSESETRKAAHRELSGSSNECCFCLTYLLVSLTASLRSPATLWAEPFALSNLPSDSNFLSPVTLPAVSLIVPLTLSAVPFTCSRSIWNSFFPLRSSTNEGKRERFFSSSATNGRKFHLEPLISRTQLWNLLKDCNWRLQFFD
jgi:hypothetical protein